MFGSVAEWSKALVLGTSLFGGVGSNPAAAILTFYLILQVISFDEIQTMKFKGACLLANSLTNFPFWEQGG